MALEAGTTIGDKYRFVRRLGVGGMGEVWAAVNVQNGQEVAVKIMLPAGNLSREVYARFKREAQVLGRIRSEYVARVLDFMSDKKLGLALILELIPGQTLSAILAAEKKLPIETLIDLGYDVSCGLRDLHASKVVHRDLKPGNIVLNPRPGDRARAIIIDFGVSRILSDPGEEEITAITRDDRVLGTLEYMAPEQIIGSRTATASSDLYALGAMLYRAVCGHHCFGDLVEGKLVVAKLNQDAPPLETGRDDAVAQRLVSVITKLVQRRPRDRYASAEELINEFIALKDLAQAPSTTPMLEISIDSSGEDELPTESLSLDTNASRLVAAARAEPASSPSSVSSLTPAISPPPLRRRSLASSVALMALLVTAAAGVGVVIGASLTSKGVLSKPTTQQSSLSLAQSAPSTASSPTSDPVAVISTSASASASASAVAEAVAAPDASPSSPVARASASAASTTSASRPSYSAPAAVPKPPKPKPPASSTAAASATAKPAQTSESVYIPDGL